MTFVQRVILRLYPADVRVAYQRELIEDLERGGWRLSLLAFDGLAERAATLYSHPSFRGRRRPNPGQVRPPNMSKRERYGSPLSDPSEPSM